MGRWFDGIVIPYAQSQCTLEALPLGALKQLKAFGQKLSRQLKKLPFISEYQLENFKDEINDEIKKRKGEDDAPPSFEGYVHVPADLL